MGHIVIFWIRIILLKLFSKSSPFKLYTSLKYFKLKRKNPVPFFSEVSSKLWDTSLTFEFLVGGGGV